HLVRDRAPAVHDPPGGRDHRARGWPDRRSRTTRRAGGAAGRHLRRALRDAAAGRPEIGCGIRLQPGRGGHGIRRPRAARQTDRPRMIKSMTGFASVTREDERATIAVTVRGLNHRYLDLQLRIPQSLAAIESDVRALVSKHVARGRVELSLSLQLRQLPGVDIEFNED